MTANQELINKVVKKQQRNDHQSFKSGDIIRVHIKIKEGIKERVQIFEGFVLKTSKKQGSDATFTVRKESYGIGVEKTFFLNSPAITKIEIIQQGKVRQARLFYMRELKGKSARIKPKMKKHAQSTLHSASTPSTSSTNAKQKKLAIKPSIELKTDGFNDLNFDLKENKTHKLEEAKLNL